MLNRIRIILSVIIITALLLGSGLPFGAQPVIAAEGEGQDLPPLELPKKGNPKLDSQLNQLVSAQTSRKAAGFAQESNIELVDGGVRVTVECLPDQVDAAAKAASALGVVETSYRNLLQVIVPVPQLAALADTSSIRLVRMPWYPLPDVVSEGVALINADDWNTANYTGEGVKVAILDGGFTGYASLLGTELPASVTTQSFYAGSDIEGYSSHGTACAEIVYDIAPDADFYLVNFGNTLELGNAVDYLITEGVDVISFSMSLPIGGPGDGTGTMCGMVDEARTAGILWSQSAGNYAQKHWQGDWVNSNANQYHEFNQSPIDETNEITVNDDEWIRVALKWDDTWGASGNDYDLLLVNNVGSIVALSMNTQGGGGYPWEYLSYTANYSGTYHILIGTLYSPAVVNFHLYSYNHNLVEYQVVSSSLSVPADSPNAMTLGAVFWNNPTTLESFSSQGPTKDNRVKPDLVAPDGVSTASYGSSNGTDFLSGGPGFFGTSASAPHAASAAVLVMERYPSYTPAQIQAFLEDRAVELGAAGKDNLYGWGRLDLGSPPALTPPAVTTTGTSDVTDNSATLNGNLTSLGEYSSANVSFKWGTTSGALDQETASEAMTATGAFSAGLSSLSSDTTYYFRAKATGSVTVYGDELSLATTPTHPWYAETVPGAAGMVVVTGTDVVDLAVSGDIIYAATNNSSYPLYKSTDGGVTWSNLVTSTSFPQGVSVKAVAIASDNASVVAMVAASDNVCYSTDGGSSWSDAGKPATGAVINDIDVSVAVSGFHYLAAGGTDGTDAELYTMKLDAGQSWSARYNTAAGAAANQDAIRAVKFSPNFHIDKTITCVSGNTTANDAYFQLFRHEPGAYTWNGQIVYDGMSGWATGVEINTNTTDTYSEAIVGGLASASIALIETYNGIDEGERIAFIGLGGATSGGGVTRLTDTYPRNLATWSSGGEGPIHSVAYHASGKLLAGDYDDNRVYVALTPMTISPKFEQPNRLKQPGGTNKTVVGWAGDTAVAATSGDESAFAVSTDNGYSFNDISLIDTELDVISDVAVSDNGTKLYLATYDTSDGSGNYYASVWVKSSSWRRIFSRKNFATDASAAFLVRIAPEDATAVYLAAKSSQDMWVNKDSGSGDWTHIPCYKFTAGIQDFVVESANVTYAIGFTPGCSKTTDAGSTWGNHNSLDGVTGYMITLAPNNDVLVGGSDGYIAFSKDGGATFTRTQSAGSGNVQVIADEDYASNNIVYAGLGTRVYRGNADNTTSFADRGPFINASQAVVGMARYLNVVYALSANATDSALHRAPNLKTADTSELALWSTQTNTHTFNATPQALKLSSGPKLWAIDTAGAALFGYTEVVPVITTSAATGITTNSATLNGNLDDLSTASAVDVSFEWGAISGNLTQETTPEAMTSAGAFSFGLTGLSASTTYYFRAKATGDGTSYGDEKSFTTLTPSPAPSPPSGGGGGGGALRPGTTDLSGRVSYNGAFIYDTTAESKDDKCLLTIEEGTKGLTQAGRALSKITIVEVEEPPPPPGGTDIIGPVYDIGPDGATFEPAITLAISYDPGEIPQGVAEEYLVIAYWDDDAGGWVELEGGTVDLVTHTITAPVSHFTPFAVIGKPSPPPPPPPPTPVPAPVPARVPAPASFAVSDLSVTPSEVKPAEQVTISAVVTNTGGSEGSYTVVLKINGAEEARKEVTLGAGKSETVTFTIAQDTKGSYTVNIDGKVGRFTVTVPPPPTPTPTEALPVQPPTNWWLIGGIIAGCVVVAAGLLVYLFVWRKRGAPRPS